MFAGIAAGRLCNPAGRASLDAAVMKILPFRQETYGCFGSQSLISITSGQRPEG
ncbi:MAG: hypothetical protein LBM07_04405 [Culturomica sp.]|nr:hypothetical protein [Culturomica sp.]